MCACDQNCAYTIFCKSAISCVHVLAGEWMRAHAHGFTHLRAHVHTWIHYYHSQWLWTCEFNKFKQFSTTSNHLQPWLNLVWRWLKMVWFGWIWIDLVYDQSHRKSIILTRNFKQIKPFPTRSVHFQPWLKTVWCCLKMVWSWLKKIWCWLNLVWFGWIVFNLVYVQSH